MMRLLMRFTRISMKLIS
jgi:hypothetical protein